MHWFTPLLTQIRHNRKVDGDIQDLLERVHRLEIDRNQLRERLDDLEGRHGSLSHQIRGRLGGRKPNLQAIQEPIPLGAQFTNR